MKYDDVKKYLQEMKPFQNPEDIRSVPIMNNEEDYQEYVVKNFIRCGAIPKSELEIGKTYIGNCRNASEAMWNGEQFEYQRHKYNFIFIEKINHFEDDDKSDLFVPLKLKNE